MNKKELLGKYLREYNDLKKFTDEEIVVALCDEYDEYCEAYDMVMLGDSATNLAQEGWDVLRYGAELASRGVFLSVATATCSRVFSDFSDAGIDWVDAGLLKETKSRYKYPEDPTRCNGFTAREFVQIHKGMWRDMNGDEAYYHAYMLNAEVLYE